MTLESLATGEHLLALPCGHALTVPSGAPVLGLAGPILDHQETCLADADAGPRDRHDREPTAVRFVDPDPRPYAPAAARGSP